MLFQNTFFRFPVCRTGISFLTLIDTTTTIYFPLYTAQQPLLHPHLVTWGSPFSSPMHMQNNHSVRRELPNLCQQHWDTPTVCHQSP